MSSQPTPMHSGQVDHFQVIKWGTSQNVAIGAGSVQSSAASNGVQVLRIIATVNCWVKIGANPTATTSSTYVRAGVAYHVGITQGDKVAVIQDSTSGTLNITEASSS